MLNVAIVDDEAKIRLGLAKLIQRAGEGFRVAGAFASGAELLERLGELEADLVITDVKMPNVDGLELIERIRQARPEVQLAVVSGFDDFAYARRALRNGVLEYLLKPVDEDELRNLLHRVKAHVEAERSRRAVSLEYYVALAAGGEADRLPQRWRNEVLEELRKYKLFAGYAAAALVLAEPALGGERLEALARDWPHPHCAVGLPWGTALVVSLGERASAGSMDKLAAALLARMPANVRVRVGLSGAFRGPDRLAGAFAEAEAALQQAWYSEGGAVCVDYGTVRESAGPAAHPFFLLDREFWPAVDALDVPRAMDALRAWTEEAGRRAVPWKTLEAGCEAVYALLRGEAAGESGGEETPDWDPRRHPDWASYAEHFLRLAGEALGKRRAQRRENRVVEKIKAYIRRNYRAEIELSRLAEEVFLSPSYLSKMFRAETGETITDYIISYRIARARELLDREDGLKTYEIGELVGYPDPAYFNKVFKKMTGMTPREYRERVR